MIIYNVTIAVDPQHETEFLRWLADVHIPEVLETGLFLTSRTFKIRESPDNPEYNSFAVQYEMESWEKYIEYRDNHAAVLQQKTKDKYGDKVLAFRTFLEQI